MVFREGRESKPFGKRIAQQETAAEAPARMSPEMHVQLMRGMRDQELNGMLDDWEGIRAYQKSGHSAGSDDARALGEIFSRINERLGALGKRAIEPGNLP